MHSTRPVLALKTKLHGGNRINMFNFRTCNLSLQKGVGTISSLKIGNASFVQKMTLVRSSRALKNFILIRPNVVKCKELVMLSITREPKLRYLSIFQ